jgi:hypothetical protein
MSRQRTRLSDKDFKLLKKEGMGILGESGHLFPTFGNSIEDFIKFTVYDMNDTYLKSGISEDFENDGDNINLKPGNDLRKIGFSRGNFKVKYFFYRRLAGSDEIVLTKTVGDESGVVHSGNPQLTGLPMGAFYVDDEGKVFEGENPPTDGSPPSELDVKEYKFFIDEISADRMEVRLATQAINLMKYKKEFNELSNINGEYNPVKGFGDILSGGGLNGIGKFNGVDDSGFKFDVKANGDPGFEKKYVGGTLEVENAFVIDHELSSPTSENSNWSLEDPIPEITVETQYPNLNATIDVAVMFSAKTSEGNIGPEQLSYYWDFGCGHQEFGGPEITHTYSIAGGMEVSLILNTPNFTDTVTYGPLIVGEQGADDTSLEYIPDGSVVRKWTTGQNSPSGPYYLIQEGKKRTFGSGFSECVEYLESQGINTHPTKLNDLGTDFELTPFDITPHIKYLDDPVINAIPVGPNFTQDDLAGTSTTPFYNITVEAGTGGSVTGQGNSTTGGTFEENSTIYITAQASEGMVFVNWTDSSGDSEISNTNSSSTSAVVRADSIITAHFQSEGSPNQYDITVEAGPGGSVTGGGTYPDQTVVDITANPGTNYEFSGWMDTSGVVTDVTDSTTTVLANQHATIQANFTAVPTYTLSVTAGSSGGETANGKVSIDSNYYAAADTTVTIEAVEGSTHTLYAWPDTIDRGFDADYAVQAWDDNDGDSESLEITMPANIVYRNVTFSIDF